MRKTAARHMGRRRGCTAIQRPSAALRQAPCLQGPCPRPRRVSCTSCTCTWQRPTSNSSSRCRPPASVCTCARRTGLVRVLTVPMYVYYVPCPCLVRALSMHPSRTPLLGPGHCARVTSTRVGALLTSSWCRGRPLLSGGRGWGAYAGRVRGHSCSLVFCPHMLLGRALPAPALCSHVLALASTRVVSQVGEGKKQSGVAGVRGSERADDCPELMLIAVRAAARHMVHQHAHGGRRRQGEILIHTNGLPRGAVCARITALPYVRLMRVYVPSAGPSSRPSVPISPAAACCCLLLWAPVGIRLFASTTSPLPAAGACLSPPSASAPPPRLALHLLPSTSWLPAPVCLCRIHASLPGARP